MKKFALAIHGGAGTLSKSLMNKEKEELYKSALQNALLAGNNILKANGSSTDAVCAAIESLENNYLFNAGKGSVFTHSGTHEMDASVMNGFDKKAGAVCGVSNIKNPILLAKTIMEKSEHVLLSGAGAEEFARAQNLSFEDDKYFYDEFRFQQWQLVKDDDNAQLDHNIKLKETKFGTVGAVALDMHGNIAAGTSTGGMTNKRFNRVGDSPLIGCGTYANNLTCAVSCTGHGEYFIRAVAAFEVSALMEYKLLTLNDAANMVVHQKLFPIGGEGGLIAIDQLGNIAMPFNSEGMYRGSMDVEGNIFIGIY